METEQYITHLRGHHRVWSRLQEAVANQVLPATNLFYGPEGVGKRTCAQALAGLLGTASFEVWNYDAGVLGMAEVRQLLEKASMVPVHGPYQVFIIDNIAQLSVPVANALLKTLEQPGDYTIFIGVTTTLSLPSTLISRSVLWQFGFLEPDELATIAQDHGISVTPEAIHAANGSASVLLHTAQMGVFAEWLDEYERLINPSAFTRLALAQSLGQVESYILLERFVYWLRTALADQRAPGELRRRLLESVRRLQMNANKKLTIQYLVH